MAILDGYHALTHGFFRDSIKKLRGCKMAAKHDANVTHLQCVGDDRQNPITKSPSLPGQTKMLSDGCVFFVYHGPRHLSVCGCRRATSMPLSQPRTAATIGPQPLYAVRLRRDLTTEPISFVLRCSIIGSSTL